MTPEQFVASSELLLEIWRKHGELTAIDVIFRSPAMDRKDMTEALENLEAQLRELAGSGRPGHRMAGNVLEVIS